MFIFNSQAQTPAQWKKDHVYANGQLIGIVTPGSFTLSITPGSQTVVQGSSTTYSVAVNSTDGFTWSVRLSISGLPAGAIGSFSSNPINPGQSTTLTVQTALTTPLGSPSVTVTGTSGNQVNSAPATLTIQPRQVTSLGISPGTVFAGFGSRDPALDANGRCPLTPIPPGGCATLTVGNGAFLPSIDMVFQFTSWDGLTSFTSNPDTFTPQEGAFDSMGRGTYCPGPGNAGTYKFIQIRNSQRTDLYPLPADQQPQLVIRPVKPTSFAYVPTSIVTPQSFGVVVGNSVVDRQGQTFSWEISTGGMTIPGEFTVTGDGTLTSCSDCRSDPATYVLIRLRNKVDSNGDAWFCATPPTNTLTVATGSSCPVGCPGPTCPPGTCP